MAELKDKLITVESAKVIHDSLNSKFDNVIYSSEDDSEASSVPVNADTLGGTPASEYATKEYVASEYTTKEYVASEYATKGYVTTAINEALGVIENGTY